jgi:4-hydroxy-3-methylbut-2-enyl diphosphate reductase
MPKKMQIKVAPHSGFCFGVKRAINIAERTLKDRRYKDIYSLGPIIHNPQVVGVFSRKGLEVIDSIDRIKEGAVIISSHGAPKEIIEKIKKKNLEPINATCPFVKHAQNIVKTLRKQGYKTVIIGDRSHPEVKALLSLAETRPKTKKIGVISQTTQNKSEYIKGIASLLKGDFSELRVFNTICNDTANRQTLTRRLLKECDLMVVIGGKNSANTKRLWQICRESGVVGYHIETEKELKKDYFKGKGCVGVVSGASTPDEMVKKVVQRIKEITNPKHQITNKSQ